MEFILQLLKGLSIKNLFMKKIKGQERYKLMEGKQQEGTILLKR